MGSITTGVGLVSGIDTGSLIDQLIILESIPKLRLEDRIGRLQAQQTALLDINARLLNLKNAAASFRLESIFSSSFATSSNEDVLAATTSKTAQPGSYKFIVKQLVATSQKLTRGFVDRDTTPLGLESLSFELGRGRLATDTALENLNGGNGVARGRISITDRAGNQAQIDLTDVTSLDEVIDRINTAGISVTASAGGDGLVITDTSGATASNLIVADVSGYTTATDLGITGNVAADSITGTTINTLGLNTALTSLNDGNGVVTSNNVADFIITARDGTVIDVDLGRVNADIDDSTLLADLNNGVGITISDDEENADLTIVDRDGTSHEINLTDVTTVGELRSRIASETGGRIELTVTDGEKFTVTDTIVGTGNLRVLGAGDNGTSTAEDLGILNEIGVDAETFDGSLVPNLVSNPPAATIGDVIDRINNAETNLGKVVASLGDDGVSIKLTDTTGGGLNLIVARGPADSTTAADLGILNETGVASSTLDGERLIASLNSVLVRNLNGGNGLAGNTTIDITGRNGNTLTLNNLDTFNSLSEIVDAINQESVANGAEVTASLNNAGTGLLITDTSGLTASNLIVAGDAAESLGIEADVAENSVRGSSLQLKYVSTASRLSDLNYGRGVGTGSFRITDGLGESAVVNIDSDAESLNDVILEINSRGLAINARVNDNGDGIIIEEDIDGQTPFTAIKIESISGTVAQDLNIVGESDSVLDGAFIDGSYERTIDVTVSDSLDDIADKINDAGIPVFASVINTGSGAKPFRLSLTSAISGERGDLILDTGAVDLGLSTLSEGRDAKVFFGSDNPETAFLVTSATNEVSGLIDGVTIDLLKADENPVTLTVERDETAIGDAVKQFVTTFNDVVGRISDYDFFDTETEQRGVLLGNPTTAQVRAAMFSLVQRPVEGVESEYQYLFQVGITVGSGGQLEFDQTKFDEAYARNPEAVENLFAASESVTTSEQGVDGLEGVTIQAFSTESTVRGVGQMFDDLLDGLTNSLDGTVELAKQNFDQQIKLVNDRIAVLDDRLEVKRAQLVRQFTAMETALAKIQGQSGFLNSLLANVQLAQSSGGSSS